MHEDLAYRAFFVSQHTITRDLNMLRTENPRIGGSNPPLPIRNSILVKYL